MRVYCTHVERALDDGSGLADVEGGRRVKHQLLRLSLDRQGLMSLTVVVDGDVVSSDLESEASPARERGGQQEAGDGLGGVVSCHVRVEEAEVGHAGPRPR